MPAPCERSRLLVAIVGPTGAGKSELALEVAGELAGEIVNCDALQVYRELDIGTGKLGPEKRRGIPHHMLDVVPPTETFSAAEYVARAAPIIEDISARGRLPTVVGGTGLYLRALRRGLFEGPGRSPEIRRRLERIANRWGAPALHRLLRARDPESARRIHRNDRVRLIRAVEVCLAAGRPMSELMQSRRRPLTGFRDILIGLEPDREMLLQRIGRRVREMFAGGWTEEVRRLERAYGPELPAFKAIGYREIRRALEGEIDWKRSRELTTTATAQYAKRQMTWFRREEGVEWFHGFGDEPLIRLAVLKYLRRELTRFGLCQNRETLHAETAP